MAILHTHDMPTSRYGQGVAGDKPVFREVKMFGKTFFRGTLTFLYSNIVVTRSTMEATYAEMVQKMLVQLRYTRQVRVAYGEILSLKGISLSRRPGTSTATATALVRRGSSTQYEQLSARASNPIDALRGLM